MRISKAVIDSNIRASIFNSLNIANIEGFHKINDRQYGCIVEDDEGHRRYARIGVIVAEERDDCTADALMAYEIKQYEDKRAEKAKKAAERAEKAARDAEKRAKKATKEQEKKGD